MSYWIWKYGDFEKYHANCVAVRRQEFGADYPAFWFLSDVTKRVNFLCSFTATGNGFIRLSVCGIGYVLVDGKRSPSDVKIPFGPGAHKLEFCTANTSGLPAAFVESDVGDGTEIPLSLWSLKTPDFHFEPVGHDSHYVAPQPTPETFWFNYQTLQPVSAEPIDGGTLYDFGKETFGPLCLKLPASAKETSLHVSYGESREEALDLPNALVRDDVSGCDTYRLPARACRFVYIFDNDKKPLPTIDVTLDYEYLPLTKRGSFRCNDEKINRLWETCVYTYHLCCREVLLDGIKRDRWCWGGDAYQSYKFGNYVFCDADIVKRTTIALRGNAEMVENINTIIDYSLYWVIGLWEQYMTFGDKDFLTYTYPLAEQLLTFIAKRENKEGFLQGIDDDWTFVDWSPIDKTGAVCAEQMLYVAAKKTMATMAEELGRPADEAAAYRQDADKLLARINQFYWSDEKGAFIDSYASGKNNVTRHANIFALLYNLATEAQKSKIIPNVIMNDSITKITTPFFEGFELDIMGMLGNKDYIEDMLTHYWGAMLDLGATTVWEQYDPHDKGTEHYAMYGSKYGKSLCHAWGAGPVYLLGKYYLGVIPTAPGFKTFTVTPDLGRFTEMEGTVPMPNGDVTVKMTGNTVTVRATAPGGTLYWGGKSYALPVGETVTATRS